jgi:hypothetical protein
VQEPLHIYCRGTPQIAGGQSWLNGGAFDFWSPRWSGRRASSGESRSRGGAEDQPQHSQLLNPTEWLRIKAAVVLGMLRPVPPLRILKVNVEYALIWVDVAGRPDVEDLGRVLGDEGAGEASCYWSRAQGREDESFCLLTIVLQRPVRTAFAVPFSFPDAQRILTGILQARSLVLCLGAVPEGVSELEQGVDARTLYELATTPSREAISFEFDWAAQHELMRKIVQWAGWGL